jgi:hypothetical protein
MRRLRLFLCKSSWPTIDMGSHDANCDIIACSSIGRQQWYRCYEPPEKPSPTDC